MTPSRSESGVTQNGPFLSAARLRPHPCAAAIRDDFLRKQDLHYLPAIEGGILWIFSPLKQLTVSPLYQRVLHLRIQPTSDQNLVEPDPEGQRRSVSILGFGVCQGSWNQCPLGTKG